MYREEPNKAPQFGSLSGSVNPSCCIGPNLGSLAPLRIVGFGNVEKGEPKTPTAAAVLTTSL